MKIGVIGAMDEEIEQLLPKVSNVEKTVWNTIPFYTGKYQDHEVVIVRCGVGKVFAAMISQHLIDKYSVETILFTGVAGSINPRLQIGDVVIGEDSAHHDFDAQALGFARGQISYTNHRFFTSEKKLLDVALQTKLEGHSVIPGRILTGDQFLTQSQKMSHTYLREDLKGDVVEMEGAAVAQVCIINNIPHLIIRTISDESNERAPVDYNNFKHIVAENSVLVVEQILNNIKSFS